jgi:amidophosphoribosyltransferase
LLLLSNRKIIQNVIDSDDKIHDHCGVFGIHAPKEEVGRLTYYGLLALQHRGQESAGIAASNNQHITLHKDMGLVDQIFTEEVIQDLSGQAAIGHTRYATEGASDISNAQPILLTSSCGEFALAHNGNLVNYAQLKKFLLNKGHCLNTTTDSEVIARLIAEASGDNFKDKLMNGIPQLKGAFSLVILTADKLYAIRDQWGVRPLALGKVNGKGWVVASETTAIESIGAETVREIKPGEMIEFSEKGCDSFHQITNKKTGFCIFEYVYFSRPDSIINDCLVHQSRVKAGQLLAKSNPVKADFVIGVPDSGTSSALGYSQESKIPFQEGLIKSRYVGRTFIQPAQRIRNLGVRLKFSPLGRVLKGKKIIVIDDSIVRGTTLKQIVKMLKDKGVKEVHLRITSPPFKHPCFLGVDVSRYKELVANKNTIEDIRKELGADSLAYLSLEDLKKSIGGKTQFCTGCFNNKYPVRGDK